MAHRRFIHILYVPLIALLTASCSSSLPHDGKVTLSKINVDVARHQSYQYIDSQIASSHWWESIQDDELKHIIRYALKSSYDQKIASLNYESAMNSYKLQAANFGFNVAPSATMISNQGENFRNTLGKDYQLYTLTSSLPIDLWGSNRYEMKGRLSAVYASEMSLLQSKNVLVSSIIQSYIKMRALQSLVVLQKSKINVLEKQYQLLEEQYTLGLTSRLDMEKYVQSIDDQKLKLKDSEALRDMTAYTLAALSSLSLSHAQSWLKSSRPIPVVTDLTLLSKPMDIVRHRPDVVYFEYGYKEASMSRESTLQSFYPQMTLKNVLNLLFVKSMTSTPWSISAQFVQSNINPLYIKNSIHQKDIAIELAYNRWMGSIENAVTDIQVQLTKYQSSLDQYKTSKSSYAASDAYYQLQLDRSEHGLTSAWDTLEAKAVKISKSEVVLEKTMSMYTELTALYQSVGMY